MTVPSSVSSKRTVRVGGGGSEGLEIRVKRIHAIVRGVVQGVGFRFFTKYLAERFALSGFVRNRVDGTVELEAEGSEEAVSAFLGELKAGPPRAAHVSGIEVKEILSTDDFEGFQITY